MSCMQKLTLSAALFTALSTPSFAFFDELVIGITSVTNNLIDSTESVTNNTVNTASATMLSLSSNPGKMADRIGLMADRIGYMADRIVTTEGIMAGLAHKIIDSNQQPRVVHHYASASVPATAMQLGYQPTYGAAYANQPAVASQNFRDNPYMTASYTVVPAPSYGHAQPDNSQYSASHMIYGVSGATYNSVRPAQAPVANGYQSGSYASGYGLAPNPALTTASNSCAIPSGVTRSC